jgi:hypothetical protein
MFGRGVVVGFLEFRVADEGATVLAPVLWLDSVLVYCGHNIG